MGGPRGLALMGGHAAASPPVELGGWQFLTAAEAGGRRPAQVSAQLDADSLSAWTGAGCPERGGAAGWSPDGVLSL